jgi:hypothetical protein
MADGQQEAERWWFEERAQAVRRAVEVYMSEFHRLLLRRHEIEQNADRIARSGVLMEALRARPGGLETLLRRLRSGATLRGSLRELFGPEVPDGAAVAALMTIGWIDREDDAGADLALAHELRARQRECNEIGPTEHVWSLEVVGPRVTEVRVETRESARVSGFTLVGVAAVGNLR